MNKEELIRKIGDNIELATFTFPPNKDNPEGWQYTIAEEIIKDMAAAVIKDCSNQFNLTERQERIIKRRWGLIYLPKNLDNLQ